MKSKLSNTNPLRQNIIFFGSFILLMIIAISVWFISQKNQVTDQRSQAANPHQTPTPLSRRTPTPIPKATISVKNMDQLTMIVTFEYADATTGDQIKIYEKSETNMLFPVQTRYLNCEKNPPSKPITGTGSCKFTTLNNGEYVARYFTRNGGKDVLVGYSNFFTVTGSLVGLNAKAVGGVVTISFDNTKGRSGKATDFIGLYDGINSVDEDVANNKSRKQFKWLDDTSGNNLGLRTDKGTVRFNELTNGDYHINYVQKNTDNTYKIITTIPLYIRGGVTR